jgi:hypothetical protein
METHQYDFVDCGKYITKKQQEKMIAKITKNYPSGKYRVLLNRSYAHYQYVKSNLFAFNAQTLADATSKSVEFFEAILKIQNKDIVNELIEYVLDAECDEYVYSFTEWLIKNNRLSYAEALSTYDSSFEETIKIGRDTFYIYRVG